MNVQIHSTDASIRKALTEDARGILAIEESSFVNPGERFHLRQIRSLISVPSGEVLVAERCGQILGWAAGLVRKNHNGLAGRIYAVAVSPQARGLSLGRRLMERVIAAMRAREAGRIFLEVREDNVAAISLYRKLGFVDRHFVKDYYGRGLHARSMVLE